MSKIRGTRLSLSQQKSSLSRATVTGLSKQIVFVINSNHILQENCHTRIIWNKSTSFPHGHRPLLWRLHIYSFLVLDWIMVALLKSYFVVWKQVWYNPMIYVVRGNFCQATKFSSTLNTLCCSVAFLYKNGSQNSLFKGHNCFFLWRTILREERFSKKTIRSMLTDFVPFLSKFRFVVDRLVAQNSSHICVQRTRYWNSGNYKITTHEKGWVCGRFNARSDWLIVGHYSPAMPTGRLRACKNKAESRIINNLRTFGLYGKISNLGFAVLTSLSLGQYRRVSVWNFSVKTSLSVNKYLI